MNSIPITDNRGLILLRAGTTDLDEQGRIVGQLDVPLSVNGTGYAQKCAALFESTKVKSIYCSPCVAAAQTANIIVDVSGGKVRIEEPLVNVNHGLWHGKRMDEVKENQPKLYRKWRDQPDTFTPPEGESGADVRVRIAKTLQKIIKKAKTSAVAIVAPEPLYRILLSEIRNSAEEFNWTALSEDNEWITREDDALVQSTIKISTVDAVA